MFKVRPAWWHVRIDRRVLRSVALLVGATLLSACAAGSPPLRMNDYRGNGTSQAHWPLGRQMFLVMPVPAFNEPVHIRDVQLRTVHSVGKFDHPDAYYLSFGDDRFYGHFEGNTRVIGLQLTYQLQANDTAGAVHQALSAREVQKLDNQLSIVIPVNIHQPGCHEAQIVFQVVTSDGTEHALPTDWYVGLDTGSTPGNGLDMCAPNAHGPTPAATATT